MKGLKGWMGLWMLVGALMLMAPTAMAQRPPTDSHGKAALQLLLRMQSVEVGRKMLDLMLGAFQQMAPDISSEIWDQIRAEMDVQELVYLLVPVYTRHLSEDDINAFLAFLDTPAGRNYTNSIMVIQNEAQQVGEQYGQQVGAKIMQRVMELQQR